MEIQFVCKLTFGSKRQYQLKDKSIELDIRYYKIEYKVFLPAIFLKMFLHTTKRSTDPDD